MSAINKYRPYKDVDGNGVIIVTPFDIVDPNDQTNIMFMNISGMFNGKGLPPVDPQKSVTFDFRNVVGKSLTQGDLDFIIDHIEKLYTNEINSLCLRDIPELSYNGLAGMDVRQEGSIQWDRSDFDKIIAHLRMVYDGTLTKQ